MSFSSDLCDCDRCKFAHYLWNVYGNRFRVEVNTQFLSPRVTYTVYIVFQHCGHFSAPFFIPFKYKLDEETDFSTSCIAYQYGEWVMTKLYRFTSDHDQQNLNIEFLPTNHIPFVDSLAFHGIEIRPTRNVSYVKWFILLLLFGSDVVLVFRYRTVIQIVVMIFLKHLFFYFFERQSSVFLKES